MGSREEVINQIRIERAAFAKAVIAANKDLSSRMSQEGVRFELDEKSDSFTILVGIGSRDETYTQTAEDLELDLDINTDKIIGITVHAFAQSFLKTKAGRSFAELLPVLRDYGPTICIPPKSHGTKRAASQLRSLVPAFA